MPAYSIQRNLERHPGGEPRARRLPLQLIIRYRPVGDPSWRKARTKNVSRSGVLFLTDEVLDVTTALEMALSFELDEQDHAGEARMVGAVVRHQELAGVGIHAIAASIEDHRLIPADSRKLD